MHMDQQRAQPPSPLCPLLSCRAGEPELDSQRFAKLCKECGLTDRRFSQGYADVAFTLARKNKKEQCRWAGGWLEWEGACRCWLQP